jgi:protein O-GlcNAc transferase
MHRALTPPPSPPHDPMPEFVQLAQQGDIAGLEPKLRRHLSRKPADLAAQYLLGWCLAHRGKPAEACYWLKAPAEHEPPQHDALLDYAHALFESGKRDQAVDALFPAAKHFPDSLPIHRTLARFLVQGARYVECMEVCVAAMPRHPHEVAFVSMYANSMGGLGQAEMANAWNLKAIALAPDDIDLHRIASMQMCYVDGLERSSVLAAHQRYGTLLAQRANVPADGLGDPLLPVPLHREPLRPTGTSTHATNRRIRLGILTGDFRDHPVGRFMIPILEHLDPAAFEVHAYVTRDLATDPLRNRLKQRCHAWHDIESILDSELVAKVRTDKIDVLLELSGLTMDTRIGVIPARAAPVQVNYLGYPHSTGVPGMDFRIVDDHTDPQAPRMTPLGPMPGAEAYASETLLRLPGSFLCFQPDPGTPEVVVSPARWQDPTTPVVFGSFNNPFKITDTTLQLWKRVLDRVPNTKLLIKGRGLQEPKCNLAFAKRFAQAGIDIARLEAMVPTPDNHSHLAAYEKVDIALDTFPYQGTTTTCEALWMGVPVVSLIGTSHASRVAKSILTTAGLSEFLAQSPEEYARIAELLAKDRARLATLRRSLRERLAQSPLCDAKTFTANFAAAIESVAANALAVARAG